MAVKYLHWCPAGCGKKVICRNQALSKRTKKYECQVCGKKYTRKQLEVLN